ncbi:MAG: N-acetyltransferase [Alphaproteobacteria bacterium]|nr:N-acetyltransferase [Alphaproteobacteria bacterium]
MSKPQSEILVRPRALHDDAAIAAIVAAAFANEGEVRLIERLRRDGDMQLECVAVVDETVVGHIAFSRLDVHRADRRLRATALAPLAVTPTLQRSGVGKALTRTAVDRLRAQGEELIVVLGNPTYYHRFGFSSLLAKLLDAPYAGDSFMALELVADILGALRWKVAYPRAFAA